MQVTNREQDGVAIVTITGEIDSKTAPDAQGILLPFVEQHHTIVMDLNGVSFMSSAGLRMMLLLYRHATAGNGKVAIVGLSDQIRDTMAATGFLGFFVVCGSIGEALTAVKQ
jgi:anti-sigma B factor antagonist